MASGAASLKMFLISEYSADQSLISSDVQKLPFTELINPWRQNPKVHRRMHNSPLTVPILSQVNPLHTPQPMSLRSILIPSSHLRLGLSSGLFLSGFHTKILYTFLPSPMRATCPAHLIQLLGC
jgi:hypothetical protein